MIVYTDSPGYPELGETITFNVSSSITFTADPLVCNVGDNTTITASLVGSDISSLSSLSFGNPLLVTFTLGTETISGGNISIPVTCVATGSTTYDIFVIDLETDVFNDSANVTVNPAPATPYMTVSTPSITCVVSEVVQVVFTYFANGSGEAWNAVNSLTSTNPSSASAFVFSQFGDTFTLNVNCSALGTGTINFSVQTTPSFITVGNSFTFDVNGVPSAPYFSGGTSHNCTVGDQLTIQFEYIENEPASPTLATANANASGGVSVQLVTLINANRWVSVVVNCDTVGSGTVDVFATTTSGLYPNVDVTGISFTVAAVAGTPYIVSPADINCTVGQQAFVSYMYSANGGEGLQMFNTPVIVNTANATIANVNPSGNYLDVTINCLTTGTTAILLDAYSSPSFNLITAPSVQITVNP
jgi:hypothetical protein